MNAEITETTIDEAINKCQRFQEVTKEINTAWEDIIDIFKQAAADCGYEEVDDD